MDRTRPLQDSVQKLYRTIVDGEMSLLENVPRDEVATKGDVSGAVENSHASTMVGYQKTGSECVLQCHPSGI